jgi:hypothetical protein
MDPLVIFQFRAVERIVGVIIGGVAIYLGYRLFLNTRVRTNNEGRISLPGGIGIYLVRVGPGVFFALFGTVVVSLAFLAALRYEPVTNVAPGTEPLRGNNPAPQPGSLSYLSPTLSEKELEQQVYFLNATLPKIWGPALPESRRTDLRNQYEAHAPQLKLGLLRMAWQDGWGDFNEFKSWVDQGAVNPPPADLSTAAKYFAFGEEPGP